jgi:hypothetical protein
MINKYESDSIYCITTNTDFHACCRSVLDDFDLARKAFPNDQQLKTVHEALQLSQHGLNYDPNQLATQLLGRLQGVEVSSPGCYHECIREIVG